MDDPELGAASDLRPDAQPAAEQPALNPRQVRARRRRRRRRLGTLLFVIVAGAILATAYFAVESGDDSSDDASSGTGGVATTTTAPPFVASYKVTTGVNVRQGPGTTSPTVGVVEEGRSVTAVCVVEGEAVNAATGSSTQWLRVAGGWPVGYVSAAYVVTGDDLVTGKVPTCPTT